MNVNDGRIIHNTLVVYGQLVVSMLIGLFSVRFVLQALGDENYGIYMVVGGVVSMLNIITTSLSNASMRFMSNSLGQKNIILSGRIFNTALLVHILFGILLVAVLELGGWIMFKYYLNIPADRTFDAQVVYQFMVITAFISLISVPFDAVINAHENMLFLSIVTIFGQIVQLCLALYLLYICSYNKLIIYGLGLLINQILLRLIKQIYCNRHYSECALNLRRYFDSNILWSMLSFVGWDFVSTAMSVLTTNLKNLFVNMFFGVKLNAGQGIATNVSGYVNNLSRGITSAITPQMNKSEGAGDRARLIKLTFVGVKYTSFMFALFAVPLIMENRYILGLWLGSIPSYAVVFCQLIMINQLTDKLTWQICNAIRSVGNLKYMTILECISNLLYVCVIYNFLEQGYDAEYIYILEFFFIIINGLIRIYLGHKLVGIKIGDYVQSTIVPVLLPMIVPVILTVCLQSYISESILRTILVFGIFIMLYGIFFIIFGLSKVERRNILDLMYLLRGK